MRVGLFGGSFDPVHLGHLLLAEQTGEKYRLDRVLFLPSGVPPHKHKPRATSAHRLAMLRLAVRGNARLYVSDWEIEQQRKVFSIETVDHFHRQWPDATFYFLVGSDALKTLRTWKESARLRKRCRFVGIDRIAAFSSTQIRRRLARGQSVRYLVPPAVEDYLQVQRLYRS